MSKRRNILIAVSVLLAGAAATGLAGYLAIDHHYQQRLSRAQARLADDLQEIPLARFGRVFSSRSSVQEGQWVDLDALTTDLSASGYLEVESRHALRDVNCVDAFYRRDDRRELEVRTCSFDEVATSIETDEDGIVTSIHPGPTLDLPPLMLTRLGEPDERRTLADTDSISEWVVPALLAAEDERFFNHPGVDAYGVARAAVTNAQSGEIEEGASTLTQQLVKNTFLTPERSYERKIEEAFLAMAVERRLTKAEILDWYLSEAYFGHVKGMPIHGIEDAAQAYFGLPASSLSLSQAATLVAMLPQPNRIDPIQYPDKSRAARDRLIDRMVEVHAVTEVVAEGAKREAIEVSPRLLSRRKRAAWAVDWAIDELPRFAEIDEPDTVMLTIDPILQSAADESVTTVIETLREQTGRSDVEASMVVLRPDSGEVVAVVGAADYNSSPFDRSRRSWREVGSTVKPFILATALDRGTISSPLDRVNDSPFAMRVGDDVWAPKNYSHSYRGSMPVHRAVELSRNAAMVRLASHTGFSRVRSTLRDSGFERIHGYPSIALGAFPSNPVEMASAYTAFANDGVMHEATILRRIVDGDQVVNVTADRKRVFRADHAAVVRSVMQGVATRGTAAKLRWKYKVEGDIGGKTGTTDDGRDSWFVAVRPDLVIVAWVGADHGEPLGLTGSSGALLVVADYVGRIPAPESEFEDPAGVVEHRACVGGYLPMADLCPCTEGSWSLTFLRRAVPIPSCPVVDTDEPGDTDEPAPSTDDGSVTATLD